MPLQPEHLEEPVTRHMRREFVAVEERQTVADALAGIRARPPEGAIVYFYVTDASGRLTGVLSTRALLAAPLDRRVGQVMDSKVVAIPESFTVLDACEMFVMHKFLAFPVVDAERRLRGVVDVQLFAGEILDLGERAYLNNVFEWLGLRLAQLRDASWGRRFRARFPWLLATLASGACCALMAGLFRQTLANAVALAMFLTLVLGLGESVCVQSLSLTIHQLAGGGRLRGEGRRDLGVAVLLAAAVAVLTAVFAGVWLRDARVARVLLLGVFSSVSLAAALGRGVPLLLHRWKLDLKIAAGPVALALADIGTVTCYLSIAAALLD